MQSTSLSHMHCNPDFTGILREGVEYLKNHICSIFSLRINLTASLVAFVFYFWRSEPAFIRNYIWSCYLTWPGDTFAGVAVRAATPPCA